MNLYPAQNSCMEIWIFFRLDIWIFFFWKRLDEEDLSGQVHNMRVCPSTWYRGGSQTWGEHVVWVVSALCSHLMATCCWKEPSSANTGPLPLPQAPCLRGLVEKVWHVPHGHPFSSAHLFSRSPWSSRSGIVIAALLLTLAPSRQDSGIETVWPAHCGPLSDRLLPSAGW